ncbi:unnamed protein product, partial [Sphacelaria rigidula]
MNNYPWGHGSTVFSAQPDKDVAAGSTEGSNGHAYHGGGGNGTGRDSLTVAVPSHNHISPQSSRSPSPPAEPFTNLGEDPSNSTDEEEGELGEIIPSTLARRHLTEGSVNNPFDLDDDSVDSRAGSSSSSGGSPRTVVRPISRPLRSIYVGPPLSEASASTPQLNGTYSAGAGAGSLAVRPQHTSAAGTGAGSLAFGAHYCTYSAGGGAGSFVVGPQSGGGSNSGGGNPSPLAAAATHAAGRQQVLTGRGGSASAAGTARGEKANDPRRLNFRARWGETKEAGKVRQEW